MKTTTVHINALIGVILLAIIAIVLVVRGDNCAGVGVAGLIAPIIMHFARRGENGVYHNEKD